MPHGALTAPWRHLRSNLRLFAFQSLPTNGRRLITPTTPRFYNVSKTDAATLRPIWPKVQSQTPFTYHDQCGIIEDEEEEVERWLEELSADNESKLETPTEAGSEGLLIQALARAGPSTIIPLTVRQGFQRYLQRLTNDGQEFQSRLRDWNLLLTAQVNQASLKSGVPVQTRFESSSDVQGHSLGLDFGGKNTVRDTQGWVSILLHPDSAQALTLLKSEIAQTGPDVFPFVVFFYVVRRKHISGGAMRLAIVIAKAFFDTAPISASPILLLTFENLIRHARQLWPQALEPMTRSLLVSIDRWKPSLSTGQLTYIYNEAMRMVSLTTTSKPFKDVPHRERAVILILQHMAGHEPVLQLDREGYRAVIRVQLARKKTDQERRWAGLQALSWPPWKEDRTRMDSNITVEEHGLSKAAQTLIRMEEAGYAPLEWERTARLYAGWDVDGTPTIQSRVLFGLGQEDGEKGSGIWAARITTTRTAQEAWAAYLACEGSGQPLGQDVYLAIFQKLYEEERRQRNSMQTDHTTPHQPYRAGEVREASPLPPSSHLYTYTASPPPTMDQLWLTLTSRGITFADRSLAYLVSHASSLRRGINYLRRAEQTCPSLTALTKGHTHWKFEEIPNTVFKAFIHLLSRRPYSRFTRITTEPPFTASIISRELLNGHYNIVRAIDLLHHFEVYDRPAWNSVLRSLSHRLPADVMSQSPQSENWPPNDDHDIAAKRIRAIIAAYWVFRRTLSLIDRFQLSLDLDGFHSYCRITGVAGHACWLTLKEDVGIVPPFEEGNRPLNRGHVAESTAFFHNPDHLKSLRLRFKIIVGEHYWAKADEPNNVHSVASASEDLPRLLATPSPATLHEYIRALGWTADFEGVLELLTWMRDHRNEIDEAVAEDRNGWHQIRLAMTALRVFLERTWLQDCDSDVHFPTDRTQSNITRDRRVQILSRLQASAPTEIIESIREIVDEVEEWGGWASDEEVLAYCDNDRFQVLRKLYVQERELE